MNVAIKEYLVSFMIILVHELHERQCDLLFINIVTIVCCAPLQVPAATSSATSYAQQLAGPYQIIAV